jgi:hypothetical protein
LAGLYAGQYNTSNTKAQGYKDIAAKNQAAAASAQSYANSANDMIASWTTYKDTNTKILNDWIGQAVGSASNQITGRNDPISSIDYNLYLSRYLPIELQDSRWSKWAQQMGPLVSNWVSTNFDPAKTAISGYRTSIADYNKQAQDDLQAAATADKQSLPYLDAATKARLGQQQTLSQASIYNAQYAEKMANPSSGLNPAQNQLAQQNLEQQQKDAAAAAAYQAQASGSAATGSPAYDMAGAKKSATAATGATSSAAPQQQQQKSPTGAPMASKTINQSVNSANTFNIPYMGGLVFGG